VLARLAGKHHPHALTLLRGGVAAQLLSMPPAALSPPVSALYTSLFAAILEDPATLQSTMEARVRSLFAGHTSHAFSGGKGMTLRAFLAAADAISSRDPAVFATAVANVCEVTRPAAPPFGAAAARDAAAGVMVHLRPKRAAAEFGTSVLPAKRTASGALESRKQGLGVGNGVGLPAE